MEILDNSLLWKFNDNDVYAAYLNGVQVYTGSGLRVGTTFDFVYKTSAQKID